MKTYRYVTLDPTGNLTCLVLDPADPADEAALTRKLLEQCEQVAYLVPPVTSAEKVRDYVAKLHGMEGLPQARLVVPRLIDNAWSPREAIIALLARRPTSRLGYGMPPIVLNSRVDVDGGREKAISLTWVEAE